MSTTATRRQQLKELFFAAMELPQRERLAVLTRVDDAALRLELQSLLEADEAAGSFLESGIPGHLLDAAALVPGQRLGAYEIIELIGRGGMGEVYSARDTRLRRQVAIKVLDRTADGDGSRQQRLEKEARAAGGLNHPNILTVYDLGTLPDAQGSPFIVMELLRGETLRSRLDREPQPPRSVIVDYALQMARGLAAAHAAGIVHRDFKPENLFVTENGFAKILDFGVAKTSGTDGEGRNTAPGMVIGTAGYMAPEQIRGEGADTRSDIFAFGTVLFEMVTGRRAFSGPSSVHTMSAILDADPLQQSAAAGGPDSDLLAVVQRCIRKRPADRYQQITDVIAALELVRPLGRRRSGRPVPVAVAIALAATIALITLALWR